MPELAPVLRRSVPDAVADQLEQQILGGSLPAGDDLPSERALAEALGVSRPTVREALRRLEQRGLVAIRQGGSTTVRDFRQTAGLDLLPQLLLAGGELDLGLVADIVRARSAIAPQLARAAAERPAGDPDDATLLDLAAQIAATGDPVAQQVRALAFWSAIVDRSGSMVYRLLYNGLRDAFEPGLEALAGVLQVEAAHPTAATDLARAVVDGDADAAERAAGTLLARGHDAVLALLEQLDPPASPTTSPSQEPT
jgi:GntR family transcriptional repressor for pyruvate dehydrogenase complex